MIRRQRLFAVASSLLALLLLPAAVMAQPASPITASLFLENLPADSTYDPATPIKLTLVLQNVTGAPIITTDGFAATDFWRLLYFNLANFGIITNAAAAPAHGFVQYGTCHYRQSVIVPSVQVVPVEVLPANFALQFSFDDVRSHFDLSRPGHYTVTARLSFLTYGAGAIINDCNIEFSGKSLLSIGDGQSAERQQFDVVSNTLEFFIRPSDIVPPTTTASPTPAPNGAGWNKTLPVSVALTAVDNIGGSGVKNIGVTLFGAQTGSQTINGASGFVQINTQGVTTLFFGAEDNAGNKEAPSQFAVRVDTTAPVVTAPAAITVAPTEAGGARGSASSALATFLAGGSATDNLDPSPVKLADQVGQAGGPVADNSTLFPFGTTSVIFRFQDVAGNTGTANSSVTVTGGPPAISAVVAGSGKKVGTVSFYDVKFSNTGGSPAQNVLVKQFTFQTLTGAGKVSYEDSSPPLPINLGTIAAGASKTVRVYFTVPPTVSKFSVTETGSFVAPGGATTNFSTSQTITK